MSSPTMTLADVVNDLRSRGVKTKAQTISAGIASGAFPFGTILSVGETGRRHILIFRSDYIKWISDKIPNQPSDAAGQPGPANKKSAMPASTAAIPFARDDHTHLYYNDSVPMSREGMKFG